MRAGSAPADDNGVRRCRAAEFAAGGARRALLRSPGQAANGRPLPPLDRRRAPHGVLASTATRSTLRVLAEAFAAGVRGDLVREGRRGLGHAFSE